MEEWINIIVNNGISVVICAYFLYSNYKFNDKLVSTLAKIELKLNSIEKEVKNNENK